MSLHALFAGMSVPIVGTMFVDHLIRVGVVVKGCSVGNVDHLRAPINMRPVPSVVFRAFVEDFEGGAVGAGYHFSTVVDSMLVFGKKTRRQRETRWVGASDGLAAMVDLRPIRRVATPFID